MKTITVLGFQTFYDYTQGLGCCVENNNCTTIAEAKQRAKDILHDSYSETDPIQYSQVLVDGKIRYDFFK